MSLLRVSSICVLALLVSCGEKGNKGGEGGTPSASGGGSSDDGKTGKGGKAGKAGKSGAAVKKAPSRGPERQVYSLVDNRLSAHPQHAGGLHVNAGSAGFPKYMRFGRSKLNWNVRAKEGGVAVAGMTGKTGRMVLPLTEEQAKGTPTIRFRVHSAAPQRLGLRLNGNKSKEVTAEIASEGWSTVEVAAPEGVLRGGENEILLFAGKRAAKFAWVQVGGTTAAKEAPAIYDAGKKALTLAKGDGLAYYLTVPEKGLLTADVSAGCKLGVSATANGGKKESGALEGMGSAVNLASLAGQAVRLEVTAQDCDKAEVTKAALVVPGETPKLKRNPAPKHIMLIIIDSLRADRIKPINPKARPEVPVMEELATKAAFFTNAYVQGNESKASHASIWSSNYPVKHKMIPGGNAGSIDKKWYTIDELTKDQGFFNTGVSANGYVVPRRGFGTKWDKYRNHIHDGGGLQAEKLLLKIWESLTPVAKDKWFAYVGFIDTHVSWRAKEPWFSKYKNEPYSGRFKKVASGKDIGAAATGKLKLSEADYKRVRALYDSNVSYQDNQVGEVLKKLEELGIANETMIIITADHGDELFEDGRVGHGASLKETLVHVPLVLYYPPLIPAGKHLDGADVVDIVPTIADMFGVEMNKEWQGMSLLPIAQGITSGYPLMSFATKYEDVHVGRMGHWKLRAPGAGAGQLYDLKKDPLEKKDASKAHPVERRMLTDALWMMRAYNKEWRKWKWGNAANVTPEFAADMGE